MKPNRSNPLFGHFFRGNTLVAAVVISLTGLAAIPSASAQSISVNFGADRDAIDAVAESAGAVSVLGTNWNNASGASGTLASLKNSTGAITAASVTWTSGGTYVSGSTDVGTNENGDLTKGYLDDSGTGWTINIVSPYLLNNIYAIHATDQGSPANMSAVSFNGVFHKGNGTVTIPSNGVGDSWSATNWSNADTLTESSNYIRVINQPQVSIAGMNASPGRAAIAGLQIENAYTGTLAYWDLDGATPGAGGGTAPIGVWNGSNTNWSSSTTGDVATSAWTTGSAAVFSAGSTATGAYTVLVGGTQTADAVWARNGTITLGDGGSGQITLTGSAILRGDTGLTVDVPVSATNLTTAGTVTLNNGSNSVTGLASIFGTTTLGANHSFGSLAGGGTLAIGTRTLGVGGDNTDSSFAGLLTGTVSINKSGTGRLTLLNNNTGFTGTTTVSGGVLRLGNGGTTGAISGTINGTGTVEFLRNDGAVIANAFTGNGTLKFLGTGVSSQSGYDFSGATSAFTGSVSVDDSRLRIDSGDLDLATSITVADGGQAWLYAGPHIENYNLNGIGWLETAGNLGAMRFENTANVTGSVTVSTASRIVAYGTTGTISGALLGSANLEINLAANAAANGTVNLANATGFTGNMIVSRGNLNAGALGGGLDVSTGTANITGAVAGATTLNSGILNLNNGSSIGSPTVIGGALNVNTGGTVTGALNMPTGTTLGLGGGTLASGLTLSSLGADTNILNFTNTLAVTGNLTASGTQTVNLVNQPPVGGTVTLMTYSGVGSDPVDANLQNNFVLAGASANYRSATFTDTGSAITLGVGNASLTWGGTDGTNPTFWDAGTTSTPNWSGGDTRFYQGDAVTFNDTATGITVAMRTLLAPSTVTFNNTTKNFTVTGLAGTGLTGGTGLTKSGTGSLTLGGPGSTFTGAVAINGGVLNLNNDEALGYNSGITIANGSALNFNTYAPSNQGRHYSWTIAGTGSDGVGGLGAIYTTGGDVSQNAAILNLTLSGNAEVGGNNGRFDIGRSGANYGNITGGGFTLTKVGSNSVVVRAPASGITYVVNAGMLSFEDYDTASGTNPITVNGTAKVGSYGLRTHPNDVTLNTGTTLISRGGDTATWTGAINAAGNVNFQTDSNLVIDGSLTGTGNITRAGANTLVLQNTAGSYSGKIINTVGTLRIESAGAIGTATGADVISIGASTLQGGTIAGLASATIGSATQGITQTGNVTYDAGTGNTLTIGGAVTGTGNLTKANNTGAVTFQGVSSTGSFTGNGGSTTFNGALSLAGGMADIGGGMVTNINSPTVTLGTGTYGLHCILGTTNINIGTGTFADMEVGNAGSAPHTINHLAGALTVTNDFRVGHYGTETSTYNISAGSVSMPDSVTNTGDESQANLMLGIDGSGILNISGTGVVNTSSLVVNGRNETHNGAQADTLNLTGGRLNLGKWGMITHGTTYAVNLGGGTVGASANWSSSLNMSLTGTNGSTSVNTLDSVDGTTARAISLSGVLSGAGGVIKQGAGALVLSNAGNTFNGLTRVEAGTLFVRNSDASPINTLELTGGTLNPGSDSVSAAVHAVSTTLSGGAAQFRIGTGVDRINTTDLTVSAPTSIMISPVGQLTVGAEYPVIDYSGTATGLANLSLIPLPNPRYQTSLVHDATNKSINVKLDGLVPLVWTGAIDNTWDASVQNWKLVSNNNPTAFQSLDNVVFDGTAPGTVTLVGSLEAGLVTVDAGVNYTFTGTGGLTGNASILKAGAATLTLGTANTYAGTTTVNGGILKLAHATALGSSIAGTSIAASATLDVNGQNLSTVDEAVSVTGTGVGGNGALINSSASKAHLKNVTLTGDTTVTATAGKLMLGSTNGQNATLNLAGFTLTKNGNGTVILNGLNMSGAGNIRVAQGTLQIVDDYSGGSPHNTTLTGNGTLTIDSGASVKIPRFGPSLNITMPIVLNGGTLGSEWPGPNGATIASPITLTANSAFNFVGGYGTAILSGAISGAYNLTSASDAATLTGDLSGFAGIYENTSGTTSLTGTATSVGASAAWKTTGGTLSFATNRLGAANVTMNGGTLQWNGTNTQDVSAKIVMVANKTATFDTNGNNITFTNSIGNSLVASLTKIGAGSLTLSGANTYSGNTVVNAGTLQLADNARLTFTIGTTSGASNNVSGAGTVTLNGDFAIDTTAASSLSSGTWVLENVPSLAGAYGSTFTVVNPDGSSWTDAGADIWTKTGTGGKTWTFDEATGTLTLATVVGYDSWNQQILNVADRDRSDDPDGDGLTNLQEFLFGKNPIINDGALVTSTVSGSNLVLSWLQRESGAAYPLKESTTLDAGSWTSSTVVPELDTQTGVPADYDKLKAIIPLGSGKKFFRVEATENAP